MSLTEEKVSTAKSLILALCKKYAKKRFRNSVWTIWLIGVYVLTLKAAAIFCMHGPGKNYVNEFEKPSKTKNEHEPLVLDDTVTR